MKHKRKELQALIIFLAVCGVAMFGLVGHEKLHDTPTEVMPKESGSVRFTAAGDYGANNNTRAVLKQVKAANPDFHIAVGDFSYTQTANEREWCTYVKSIIGKIPFQLISGNHESDGEDGYIGYFRECLPDRLNSVGDYGKEYYFDYPQESPLVRVVLISPDLTFGDEEDVYMYDEVESERYALFVNTVREAKQSKIPWVVAVMHKNCISISSKDCSIRKELFETLLREDVDLIVQGHAHTYERTYQLTCLDPKNASCIVKPDGSRYKKGIGPILAIIGTGGKTPHDINTKDADAPFFTAFSGKNKNLSYGIGMVDISLSALKMSFVSVLGGPQNDFFSIEK
ncbi:MAG: metallophosphoesterase [Patescibacteria group bacterium]